MVSVFILLTECMIFFSLLTNITTQLQIPKSVGKATKIKLATGTLATHERQQEFLTSIFHRKVIQTIFFLSSTNKLKIPELFVQTHYCRPLS